MLHRYILVRAGVRVCIYFKDIARVLHYRALLVLIKARLVPIGRWPMHIGGRQQVSARVRRIRRRGFSRKIAPLFLPRLIASSGAETSVS